MITTGTLNHIDISVGHPERSIPFYDAFFGALGYRRRVLSAPDWSGDSPRRATWSLDVDGRPQFEVEIRPARADLRDRRYNRFEPGPHHLAFNADSPDTVRRVHEAMRAAGADVLDPPADYGGRPGYSAGYYAVFFADPDNLKLEVAYIPSGAP